MRGGWSTKKKRPTKSIMRLRSEHRRDALIRINSSLATSIGPSPSAIRRGWKQFTRCPLPATSRIQSAVRDRFPM